MSVIDALSHGECFDWLVLPQGEDVIRFFRELYLKINILLQSVRQELAHRSIDTSSYRYQSKRENLSVRKRNRACIVRLIAIYFPLRKQLNQNSQLENLFEQLGEVRSQEKIVDH